MTKPIRKAVILAGGLNSRFLPVAKAIPKTMLPILNKPVIQYLVEEATNSGIQDIIIVTGRGKHAIEAHFDRSHELENELIKRGKTEILERVKQTGGGAQFAYVRQEEALGDGHAILCAKDFVGDEPFAVLFGDDIIDAETPALKQLIDVYEETKAPVLCTERVPKADISKYGVIDIQNSTNSKGATQNPRVFPIKGVIEKPAAQDAPSELGIIGKYVCTPDVLTELAQCQSHERHGEIKLIDAFEAMLKKNKALFALEIEGTRFDTGTHRGLLQANIHFAMKDPQLRASLNQYFT